MGIQACCSPQWKQVLPGALKAAQVWASHPSVSARWISKKGVLEHFWWNQRFWDMVIGLDSSPRTRINLTLWVLAHWTTQCSPIALLMPGTPSLSQGYSPTPRVRVPGQCPTSSRGGREVLEENWACHEPLYLPWVRSKPATCFISKGKRRFAASQWCPDPSQSDHCISKPFPDLCLCVYTWLIQGFPPGCILRLQLPCS